ncbi:sulfite exporter TauE/SafE family protein [Neobacillus ginsengisoli]|uniref:Probable membrane transporter protein n=1 Tax=Neobacillus ginsengisoli TaxID=904295 RepID=A0ABT9XZ25_9BACI|nr:sulfite exporter TauE/SafE family protein [Neobacillus ginsengisoli]MDQ0200823.1 putative membrane protein YfcA [Neobacillus ginsengisoli]
MNTELILFGFLVGGLVGFTGVGGASLLTPILIFMGFHPTIAIGTDFAYNAITKLFGAFQHIKQKTVNFQIIKYLAIGSIPGGVLANYIFYSFLSDYYSDRVLIIFLSVVLIVVSVTALIHLVMNGKIQNPWKTKSIEEKKYITIIAGLIMGAIVGVTSVGAGSLFSLFILYFFNLKTSEIVGTDIVHAFFLVFATGLLMAGYGHIDYVLTGNLLAGSIPGAIIGSKLTKKVPSLLVRILMLMIILFSGIKLIINI